MTRMPAGSTKTLTSAILYGAFILTAGVDAQASTTATSSGATAAVTTLAQITDTAAIASMIATMTVSSTAYNAGQNTANQLPNFNFTLADDNFGTRQAVCTQQMSFCANSCGFNQAATTNFCNIDTLAFDCVCSGGVIPSISTYQWPVFHQDCLDRNSACLLACQNPDNRQSLAGGGVVNQANCAAACNNNFASKCNTVNQPIVVNYLVSAASATPSFVGNPSGVAASGIGNMVSASSTSGANISAKYVGRGVWTLVAASVLGLAAGLVSIGL